VASHRLADLRLDYGRGSLERSGLSTNPFTQLEHWVGDAVDAKVAEPNAMVIATVDVAGRPSTRAVLLREVSSKGLVFFTNYESRKGIDLASNSSISASLVWTSLQRQVHVLGSARRVSKADTAAYFASRPRSSQISAWASPQSTVLRNRRELDGLVGEVEKRFGGGPVPVPPYWGGFRITPREFEFWQGRRSRLHDRFRYKRRGTSWLIDRLAP